MAFPTGISQAVIRAGSAISLVDGSSFTLVANITPIFGGGPKHIVWAATGQPLIIESKKWDGEVDALVSFSLPHVDQPGFVNGAQQAVTMWAYRIELTAYSAGKPVASWVKNLQPLVGQTVIDLDLVADGSVTAPVVAPAANVTSFNGQTGAIEVDLGLTDVEWADVQGKPSTFPPATHNHDDRYYTETEVDQKLSGKQAAGTYATPTDVSTASTADRNRANHTGQQPTSSITDLKEFVEDTMAAALVGQGVAVTYDDNAGTVTLAAASNTDLEAVRDAIGVALVGVGVISVSVDDAGNTITIASAATQNSTDAALRDRGTHTGQAPLSAISTPTNVKVLVTFDFTDPAIARPSVPTNVTLRWRGPSEPINMLDNVDEFYLVS